jgi:hypothetical protein
VNLVAIQPDFVGNLRAYATGSTPSGGVVNFATLTLAMNNSNAIAVPLNRDGSLAVDVNSPSATGPIVHIRGVILGYYS